MIAPLLFKFGLDDWPVAVRDEMTYVQLAAQFRFSLW